MSPAPQPPAARLLEMEGRLLAELCHWRDQEPAMEACGVLVGKLLGARVHVDSVHRVPNLAADPAVGFFADPGEVVALEHEARSRGLELVGFWHTHPSGSATPSRSDLSEAWPDHVLLVGNREGAWRAFWPVGDRAEPMELRPQSPGRGASRPSTNSRHAAVSASRSTPSSAAARARA